MVHKIFSGGSFFLSVLVYFIFYLLPKLLPQQVISDSEVKGIIIGNQTWRGTIRITGDLYSFPATVITVNPGTKILVSSTADKYNLDYLPWHLKSGINTGAFSHGVSEGEPYWDEREKIQLHFGRLVAIGTKDLPIVVRSNSIYGSPYDFNSIVVSKGVLSYVLLSNYRRMEIGADVTVQNSTFSEIGECGVCINKGGPTVFNNIFQKSLREAIWVRSASPRISDNLFGGLNRAGIRMDPRKWGSPTIVYNTFEMPGAVAMDIVSGDEKNPGRVEFNQFSGNSVIKIACDSKMKFGDNNIYSVVSFGQNGCGGEYVFGENYWGTPSVGTILSERITNKDINFKVKIDSILASPVLKAGKRG